MLIIKNLWQGYRITEVQLCKEETKARTALFWRDLVGVLALAQIFGEELISAAAQDINLSVRSITNTLIGAMEAFNPSCSM